MRNTFLALILLFALSTVKAEDDVQKWLNCYSTVGQLSICPGNEEKCINELTRVAECIKECKQVDDSYRPLARCMESKCKSEQSGAQVLTDLQIKCFREASTPDAQDQSTSKPSSRAQSEQAAVQTNSISLVFGLAFFILAILS